MKDICIKMLFFHFFHLNFYKLLRALKINKNFSFMKTNIKKAIDIYIDIDGVIVSLNPTTKPYPRLVPDAVYFLNWAKKNFNCYFLTCWSEEALKDLLPIIVEWNIPICSWKYMKTEAIDMERDFIWLEDGILEEEKDILKKYNKIDNYIYIDPYDDNALTKFMRYYDKTNNN